MSFEDEAMPPNDPREDALVRALHAQAETVRPAGDGLVRIRARVERRRSRTRWLVPSASAAAVAATVTAVVASGAFTSGTPSSQVGLGPASLTAATSPTVAPPRAKRVQAPVAAPTPVASPTRTARVVPSVTQPGPVAPTTTADRPVASTVAADRSTLVGPTPVWPFASAAAAADWQKTPPASDAWLLSPVDTATHFIKELKLAGVTLAGKPTVRYASDKSSATVVLQRKAEAAAPITFATVQLSHWSADEKAPWGVVSVTSSSFNVTEPVVSGPIQVSAPGSTEGQLDAAVYQAGAPTAVAHVPVPASGTVALPPAGTGGSGFVVLTNTAGGGSTPTVGSLAVVPVQLTASATPASTYVALVGGKIEVLDAASGDVLRTLAPGVPGVTSIAVTEDRAWVWFATPKGVFKTLLLDAGATPAVVSTQPATYLTVAGQQNQSWAYTYVSPSGAAQSLTWNALATTGSVKISDSLPPEAETLAIAPDGKHLASWVRGASQGTVELFALPAATDYSQGTVPTECTATVACAGATYAPDGDLLVATTDGTKVQVLRDHLGQPTPLFSVPVTAQTVSLDVDATGTKVLVVARGTGKGWVWDGTKTTALPAGVTDASW